MSSLAEIKAKLKNGPATVGSWMQLPSSDVAEIMGGSGYDWVAVDLEHGAISTSLLPDLFRALALKGTVPLARIAQCAQKDIKKALDCGAMGLIFPMVESAEQVRQAISWALYPPTGTRGVGYCRANCFGKDFDAYRTQVVPELLFVAQIEHIRAVDALEEILAVPGLDAIMVGPYDLSGSMGLTAQFTHPLFLQAIDSIREKSALVGIPMGVHVVQPDPKELQKRISQGDRFIAYGLDAVFLYHGAQCPA